MSKKTRKTKKPANTNYNVLLTMGQEASNHRPLCFGHFVDCVSCFYNKCDECEFLSWVKRGHTEKCASNMTTGDRICICGKHDRWWVTDEEYSPELLEVAMRLKEAGKLKKWLPEVEIVELCRQQGIPVPTEIARKSEKQIAWLRAETSTIHAMLTVYGEYIEEDNPDVSFLEVHKKAIKLIEDMNGDVPPPELYIEMMKERK